MGIGTNVIDVTPAPPPDDTSTLYDLVANITHQSVFAANQQETHAYSCQVRDRARDEWVLIQDLYVEPIRKELIFLGESYLQVWQRRRRRTT